MRDEQLRLKIIAMSAVPSTSDLQQLLAPLPLAALGWLCVGFHVAQIPFSLSLCELAWLRRHTPRGRWCPTFWPEFLLVHPI